MAAAPTFHLIHLPADTKANDRFYKMEVVEAQEAE